MRRGTAARWIFVDPVLDAGRPGFESDTGQLKIGNGRDRWSLLPYVGAACPGSMVLEGSSASAGQTTLPLTFGLSDLGPDLPGVPVGIDTLLEEIAVSWMSDNEPAGPWELTFMYRQPSTGSFASVATFGVNTTNP